MGRPPAIHPPFAVQHPGQNSLEPEHPTPTIRTFDSQTFEPNVACESQPASRPPDLHTRLPKASHSPLLLRSTERRNGLCTNFSCLAHTRLPADRPIKRSFRTAREQQVLRPHNHMQLQTMARPPRYPLLAERLFRRRLQQCLPRSKQQSDRSQRRQRGRSRANDTILLPSRLPELAKGTKAHAFPTQSTIGCSSTPDMLQVIKDLPSLAMELFKLERGIPI